jgi:DNA (cytosine-5)-methyltransferase 1
VLTAGFPCQPFSKSGKQEGVSDHRGTLFHDILEIAQVKKPEIILLENVRNLIGPKHISDYVQMLTLLRNAGYAVSSEPTVVSPHQISEQFGGTPQHRQRLFIAAYHVGKAKAKALIDLPPVMSKESFFTDSPANWDLKDFLSRNAPKISKDEIVRLNAANLSHSIDDSIAVKTYLACLCGQISGT